MKKTNFTAEQSLGSPRYNYAERSGSVSATRYPCVDKVRGARCMPDASGNWTCRAGFPGETCYKIQAEWGYYSCSHNSGSYPSCKPEAYCHSATCRVNCHGYGGTVCNFAETTTDCPRQYDDYGSYIGSFCRTERDYYSVRDRACSEAWRAIRGSAYCKTNCKESAWQNH